MTGRRCVIVGDVVASRDVEDREALHDRLETGIERANDAASEALVAPFATLKGVDEVGGVLDRPALAYPAIRALAEALHPTAIRFAIVWGDVDVGADQSDVSAMDGPAFHEADDLLGALAEAERYVALSVAGASDWETTLLADLLDLLFMWRAEWTPTQAAVVRQYRDRGSVTAVAEARDVTPQAVSSTLRRAAAPTIMAIERDVVDVMTERWGDPP